jgi:predicted small integral membrane protein
MMIRQSKILCVLAIAFFCFLVALGNITDYYVNFSEVKQAMMMTELSPYSLIRYRAVTNPIYQHSAYLVIIGMEVLTTILCFLGTWQLFRMRQATAQEFNDAKKWAVAGLTLGFLTWHVFFMSVAGEWFGIWMSPTLRGGLTSAFQIYITNLGVLIYLIQKD